MNQGYFVRPTSTERHVHPIPAQTGDPFYVQSLILANGDEQLAGQAYDVLEGMRVRLALNDGAEKPTSVFQQEAREISEMSRIALDNILGPPPSIQ